MKILIVEDEKDIADLLFSYFVDKGYIVDVCYDGLAGYVKAQQESYDLVCTDIMMDTMSGIEMIELMKKANEEIKIIVISAISNEIDKKMITSLGIHKFIEKPFSLSELENIETI